MRCRCRRGDEEQAIHWAQVTAALREGLQPAWPPADGRNWDAAALPVQAQQMEPLPGAAAPPAAPGPQQMGNPLGAAAPPAAPGAPAAAPAFRGPLSPLYYSTCPFLSLLLPTGQDDDSPPKLGN